MSAPLQYYRPYEENILYIGGSDDIVILLFHKQGFP